MAMNRCFLANLQVQRTNLLIVTRGFKRLRKVENEKPIEPITNETGRIPYRFWKTFGFTVAVSGASIVGAVIWEYERARKIAIDHIIHRIQKHRFPKRGFRAKAETWWKNLYPGQRVFIPICFLNSLVFIGWRIPAFRKVMNLYFTSNPAARVVGLPLLLSTFSHYNTLHLAVNMFVLHNFCLVAVPALGPEQFVAMYLISGVTGNFVSHLYKVFFNQAVPSLGCSGAVMGVLGYTCTQISSLDFAIVFLPGIKFSSSQTLAALVAIDVTGAIMRWRIFDHAAHLGGIFTGVLWGKWGRNIWQNRQPLSTAWHHFRNPDRPN